MAAGELGIIDNQKRLQVSEGIWTFDDEDWAVFAMLQDPIYMSELLFEDPKNHEYAGCYHVMDYQYPLFRPTDPYEAKPCARSVGKTESIKARAVSHGFKRQGDDMLVTAPELIHLLPLTDAIEQRIRDTHLTNSFLDTRNQQTGFTHKPFQCNFADGTKIIGRIPKITGTGVKGQHVPDLLIDEGQDYPEKGWIEVHETVMKDRVDRDGNPDFTYHFYGVHSGARDGRFYKLATSGEFKVTQITAMMRPGWGPEEKAKAASIYGGTQAPDYKRNILGEAGGNSQAFFVTARLMACLDQNRESQYNTTEWRRQRFMAEEIDQMLGDDVAGEERDKAQYDLLKSMLDLPELQGVQQVFFGADIGLVNDPTVVTLFAIMRDSKKRLRLKLVRMFHLWRFREKQIRQVFYIIGWKYGQRLRAAGYDVTGLGLPIFQSMNDDGQAPKTLLDVSQGYTFNAKLPVGVDKSFVEKDNSGYLRDQYGSMVEVVEDAVYGKRYVTRMSMIEASTRFLRDDVDSNFLLLPFDTEIASDMQGETEQRVKAMSGVKKKPAAFHILDSMRAMQMARKQGEIDSQVAAPEHEAVMARAVDVAGSDPGYRAGAI
jgi:hypothetical protein